MATATLMTAEEFVRMDYPAEQSYELVHGEPIPLPSATPLHNMVRGRLERLIGNYFDVTPGAGAISETDCRITDDTVRKPDLAIFLGEHWERLDLNKAPIPFAPDIAVEILSPSELAVNLNRKVHDYIAAGSQEVWILDLEDVEIAVRTRTGIRLLLADNSLESPLLPGFSVSVKALLAGR